MYYHFFANFALVRMRQRKIIHVDMDAFFASVEQRDNPELRGKPVAVGFDEPRGVVSTASYEARPFGVHSALSIQLAKRLCPSLIIVEPHFEKYKQVSAQVHEIFREYTELIEPISIDEAFLDVTINKKNMPFAVDIAREIKREIREKLSLTASAGVSYNKLLAKIASDYRKPGGLFVVHPNKAMDFVAQLPIEKFWGVGPKTALKMHQMGIFNGLDLRQCSLNHLKETFGKAGQIFYNFARAIDDRPVVIEHTRKSVGCERTFETDLTLRSAVIIELYHIVLELVDRLAKTGFKGRTLTLKVKYADFSQITRSLTQPKVLTKKSDILPLAKRLLAQVSYDANHPIRLMGLSVGNQHSGDTQRPRWIQLDIDFKD